MRNCLIEQVPCNIIAAPGGDSTLRSEICAVRRWHAAFAILSGFRKRAPVYATGGFRSEGQYVKELARDTETDVKRAQCK